VQKKQFEMKKISEHEISEILAVSKNCVGKKS